jgi:O-antigen/teichoic acid export membrane protein
VQNFVSRLRWLGSAATFSSAIAHTLITRIGSLILNVGMGVAVARFLGPVGRGEIGAISLWPNVMCGLLTLGVPVALRYEIRRRQDDDPSETFSAALLLGLALGVFAAAIGYFVLPRWLIHYSAQVIAFARLMILFAPQVMVYYVTQAFLEARGDFAESNRNAYVPQAITLVALCVLHWFNQLTPFSAALSYAVPSVFLTAVWLYRVRASIRWTGGLLRSGGSLLHYGLRAYGLDILSTLSAQVDQALVVGLLSATSFGLYVVALNISRTVTLLSGSLNTVLFPRASSLDSRDAIVLVARSARLIFASTVVAGLLFSAILTVAIPLAYGKAFAQDIGLARILTAEAVLAATTATLSQAFMATGRPGLVTALQACGVGTMLPLMLFFIPRYGLSGAAYALLVSTTFRLLLVLASYPLFLKHPIPRLIMDRADMRHLYGKFSAFR